MSYVSPEKLERALDKVKRELAKKLTATGIANNDTTTVAGYAADARIVKDHGIEIDNLTDRVQTLETSFPGGCRTIANAVTSNGVPTAENASPSTIATNIGKIRADGTATKDQILSGQTAWVNKVKVTGTMTNRGGVVKTLAVGGQYTIPKGYHDGTGVVTNGVTNKGTLVLTASQTGTNVDIVDGYYTHVNAKAVYDAGYSAGEAAGYDQGTADADWEVISNRAVNGIKTAEVTLGTFNLTGYRYAMIGVTAKTDGGSGYWHNCDSWTFTIGSTSASWDIKGAGGTGNSSNIDSVDCTSRCFIPITGTANMVIKMKRNCYEGNNATAANAVVNYIRLVK